jgi:hypothetical protein
VQLIVQKEALGKNNHLLTLELVESGCTEELAKKL